MASTVSSGVSSMNTISENAITAIDDAVSDAETEVTEMLSSVSTRISDIQEEVDARDLFISTESLSTQNDYRMVLTNANTGS